MRAHKFIDMLDGKEGRVRPIGHDAAKETAKRMLDHGQLFDFGKIELEPIKAEDEYKGMVVPRLTKDEEEWWDEGLIPLPFPACVFEFKIESTECALLIRSSAEGVDTFRRNMALPETKRGDVSAKGMRCTMVRFEPDLERILVHGVWVCEVDGFEEDEQVENIGTRDFGSWSEGSEGDFRNFKMFADHPDCFKIVDQVKKDFPEPEDHNKRLRNEFMTPFALAQYLLMMLTSRTTEVTKVTPDAKLVKAQLKRGASPLRSHTVVKIVPDRFHGVSEPQGGHHASPRLHWRRSHVRTYDRGLPTERRVLIARMLVGKRELGEIEHDYKVQVRPKSREASL